MKSTNAVKAQNSIPVWQPAGKIDSIVNRVRKLTRELHEIQNELYRELSEEDGSRREQSPLRQAPAHDDLKAFQAAADQLRRVLWFYLDLESQGQAHDTTQNDSASCEKRPQQSRDELAMSEQTRMHTGSFFERLNLVIDGYMQDRGIARNGKPAKR